LKCILDLMTMIPVIYIDETVDIAPPDVGLVYHPHQQPDNRVTP